MSCSHGRGHTLKSLIQFSVDEWSCVPSLLLTWGQTMVEGDSFKLWQPPSKDTMYVLLHSVPPALWQAPSDPCLPWRLLDTHWQVRVRPLWGHCSFLLGPGVHKVLFVSAKSLFPSPCKVWQLYDGINGDLLQEGLCHTQVCCTQSPCPCGSPLLTGTSTGDAQTQFCLSFCVAPGPGVHKVCLNPLNISGRNRV